MLRHSLFCSVIFHGTLLSIFITWSLIIKSNLLGTGLKGIGNSGFAARLRFVLAIVRGEFSKNWEMTSPAWHRLRSSCSRFHLYYIDRSNRWPHGSNQIRLEKLFSKPTKSVVCLPWFGLKMYPSIKFEGKKSLHQAYLAFNADFNLSLSVWSPFWALAQYLKMSSHFNISRGYRIMSCYDGFP